MMTTGALRWMAFAYAVKLLVRLCPDKDGALGSACLVLYAETRRSLRAEANRIRGIA